jgi:hypothetical protein
MNILLLGGNSQRNKQWIHQLGDELSPQFDTCRVHDYLHWNGKGNFIDFNAELSRLSDVVVNLDNYVIFAKSVGSLLTLRGISVGIMKPKKCIFAGLPIKLAEEDNVPLVELLKKNSIPTLILQNSLDPTASYDKMQKYINRTGALNYRTHEFDGDTHSYDNFNEIKQQVSSFVD